MAVEWPWPERRETEGEWLARRRGMWLSLQVHLHGQAWRLRIRCACGREIEGAVRDLGAAREREHEHRTAGRYLERIRCSTCGARPISVIMHGTANDPPLELFGADGGLTF